MGTKLRRLQVALPEPLEKALVDLANAQDRPISKVIVALLSEMEPQIRDLAKYASCVKQGKMDEAKQALVHLFGNSMAELLTEEKNAKGRKS
jgi:HEAT repeat protein